MPEPTVVISRSPWGGHLRREFEDALAAALAADGLGVLIVPHLYFLSPGHPAIDRIAELPGPVALGAWLAPRAARWTLAALGAEVSVQDCCDLGGFSSPQEAASRLSAGPQAGTSAGVEELPGDVAQRWYPVLDYDRCSDCGQCLDFCLFGVYSREGDRVVVSSPDNCKPGCPACARVCPSGAIMFPHYADDPVVAGAADRQPPAEAPAPGDSGSADEDLADLLSALDQLDDA